MGILVQRVVRFAHDRHGTRVPVLAPVGRVPLGLHHRGQLRLRWNLEVDGHKLGKGAYQVTLRALDRHRHVLGTTRPTMFSVR